MPVHNGYVFTLSQTPVSWRSILQSTVALSTIEAKYMAVTETIKEVILLQGLLDDLKINQHLLKINCDNMSASIWQNTRYIMQGRRLSMSGSILFGRLLMKVSSYRKFTRKRIWLICYQSYSKSEVCTLQRVTPYPSSCVSTVELFG